jgi:DHA1 family quinolone resistance protein-like MFS transporter
MSTPVATAAEQQVRLIRALTCLMFLMFAMTTDAVGSVIPKLIEEYKLSLTAAGAFHYVPMTAIGIGALLLGFLADRLGRKTTIVAGLVLYGLSSLLFAFGNTFGFFVGLLAMSGLGISVFKIGALALIGDISKSTTQHTSTMNLVEGFFGVGAMIGPAIVATLIAAGMSWKWLYVIAAVMCAVLTAIALAVRYPQVHAHSTEAINFSRTLKMMANPYALGFSLLIMLYVAVEVAIYVWMPTYLKSYSGSAVWLATYALAIFFVLRAAGRFLGAWLLSRVQWTTALAVMSCAIFLCFAGSLIGGVAAGVYLLPLSGLFMSVMYPTINSKGISCFAKVEHGAVAGVILFFTALSAAAGPLAMAKVGDHYGDVKYGFYLATGFALLLFVGLLYNYFVQPARNRLQELDHLEYRAVR